MAIIEEARKEKLQTFLEDTNLDSLSSMEGLEISQKDSPAANQTANETKDKSNLLEQIPELCCYLQEKGYLVTNESVSLFFLSVKQIQDVEMSIEQLEPILKPIFVKNQWEFEHFHEDLQNFIKAPRIAKRLKTKREQKIENARKSYLQTEKSLKENEEKLRNSHKKKEEELERLKATPYSLLSDKQLKILTEKRKKAGKTYTSLVKQLHDSSLEKQLLSLDQTTSKPQDIKKMQKALESLLPLAAFGSHFKEVTDYIKEEHKLLKFLEKVEESPIQKTMRELAQIEAKEKENQEKFTKALDKFRKSVEDAIQKEKSMYHRTEWGNNHRPVLSDFTGEYSDLFLKEFRFLTPTEKQQIRDYIKENTRRFKTRLSRNIHSSKKHQLDMSQTCKHACATNGIPMKLYFKQPAPSKANLLLILDVSGSCKAAAELMLTFLYYLKDTFPGGCRTYAFTNQLYDIGDYINQPNVEAAVQEVLTAIPRSGAYSNYERPLKDYYTNHLHEVNKDTITIFIGDARNNKNPSGEEYLKAIARKSKHSYWMNTDEYEKWNQGDSIIGVYRPYVRRVEEVRNTGQLLQFLMKIK